MYEPPPGREIAFKSKRRDECMESRLVLDAAGVSCEAIRDEDCWLLVVSHEDLEVSTGELDEYRRENPRRSARQGEQAPVYGGAAAAVFSYAGIIVLVAILSAPWAFDLDLLSAGCMQAGKVTDGQWWRTVTALTLHSDLGHIAGNLVFGVVFGLLAGRTLGGGVAWLAIVIAGALGNFINALVQAPDHTSIGASTAVFAALGVIVSNSLHRWRRDGERPLKRWSPLIGGVLLLAFTGVGGQRTDVVAHVTGFLAGLLIGWLGCRLPHSWLASNHAQRWAGYAAIAIVAFAWIIAVVVAGGT